MILLQQLITFERDFDSYELSEVAEPPTLYGAERHTRDKLEEFIED
jgi:hypothetical protein